MKLKVKAFFAVFFILGGSLSYAQTIVSTKAGIIEQKIEDERKKDKMFKAEEFKETAPAEDKREAIPLTMKDEKVKVHIKKFILNGVTKFGAEEFVPFLSKYRDSDLGIKALNEVVEYIQGFYRKRGYITTYVYVPEQDIKDDVAEIRVVEGYIGNIEVEGGRYFNAEVIRSRLIFKEGDTVLYKDLMKSLRRVNMHPDRAVRAILKKGEETETTDVILKVEDSAPWHMFTEYDNRGTKYTGRHRFQLGYVHNNLSGREDILSGRFIKSNERLNGGSLDYNLPVNHNLTRAGAYFSYVDTDIMKEFRPLDAKGRASIAGIYLTRHFLDEEHIRGNWGSGLDIKRSRNYLLGSKTSNDKLSVVKLNLSIDGDDKDGMTFWGQEMDFGAPHFLGAMGDDSDSASRLGSGGRFFKSTMEIRRQQNLPLSSFLLLSARTQYSPDKLVSGEQFWIGGADSVRGYPELEYMGDYGYNTSIELRTPPFLLPKQAFYDKMQWVYFWDFGEGYLRDALVGEKKSETLMSAGVGFRLGLWKNFFLRLDWGFPIHPTPSDKSKNRVHLWGHSDFF